VIDIVLLIPIDEIACFVGECRIVFADGPLKMRETDAFSVFALVNNISMGAVDCICTVNKSIDLYRNNGF
jgi:hypothetical protein